MKARWLRRLVPRSRPVLQGALAVCLVGSALPASAENSIGGRPHSATEAASRALSTASPSLASG